MWGRMGWVWVGLGWIGWAGWVGCGCRWDFCGVGRGGRGGEGLGGGGHVL